VGRTAGSGRAGVAGVPGRSGDVPAEPAPEREREQTGKLGGDRRRLKQRAVDAGDQRLMAAALAMGQMSR
jgi:hypothetical protein